MPRCKYCKDKFDSLRFNQKFCLKSECIQKANDEHWNKVRKPKTKSDLLTIQDYIKLAQQVFNKYIRQRDKGQKCISCNIALPSVFDCGHYYSAGGHWNVRFNEDNCHGQHKRPCNMDLSGDLIKYRVGLINRIGHDRLAQLDKEAQITRKFTIDELKEIIETYKQKIKQT